MPALGADMQFGTVVSWRVKPGDVVKRGDVVVLVETEKGVVEVEIFENGVIESLVIPPGQKVPVGATLAILGGDGAQSAATDTARVVSTPVKAAAIEPSRPTATTPMMEEEAVKRPVPQAPQMLEATARPRISPFARKRAAELGVELSAIAGTGEGGAVQVSDVERAAATATKITAETTSRKEKGLDPAAMRRVIAAAMARSKREIPHYYLATMIDMHRALDWLAAENAKRSVTQRILYSALLIRAVALAVRSTPELNGFCVDGAFQPAEAIHVGVAISLRQGGLINPAIHDVDKKSVDEVMASMLDLVNRARTGHLRSSELSDGTITVTNLGEQGVESVYGVIYPPQVAIVGFGTIIERPVARDGLLGARRIIEATLAADHRVSDGHRGGRFLCEVGRLLQEPEKL
jgi:pyruvate dehydrogenase E2 component (dihydrolipoamide acetyltransferase)